MSAAHTEGLIQTGHSQSVAQGWSARWKRWRSAGSANYETLRLALDALRAHKLRSLLTLIGVILAVTTLVAVMSVVAGLNNYVAERIANLGANVYVVDRFGIITSLDEFLKAQKRPPLTMEEFDLLKSNLRLASQIGAVEASQSDVRSGNELAEDVDFVGATANYGDIRNYDAALGRYFTDADDLHRAPVCFLGADVAKKLFPNVDPIGKTIRAGTHSYQVVGVSQTIGSVFGQSQDNFVVIPLGTYEKEWRKPWESLVIFVQALNAEWMEASQDEVRMLLRAKRHQRWDDADNFAMVGSASITTLWKSLTANLFNLAVGLTAVFLVVGGIVIMNIMLASVTERTREIGLRRSLGARRSHIVTQFLAESAVLAAMGGVLGIALSLAVCAAARAATGIPIRTPFSAVLVALALSTSVGLFFGIYPATRAARLDPIEALRAET